MNDLLRGLAPISEAAWAKIEEEATRTLKLTLAARKVVDFRGPLGWDASAVSNGRARRLGSGPEAGRRSAHAPSPAAGRAAHPVRSGSRRAGSGRAWRRRSGSHHGPAGRPQRRAGRGPRRLPRLCRRQHHRHRAGRSSRDADHTDRLRVVPGGRRRRREPAAQHRRERTLRDRARSRAATPASPRPPRAAIRSSSTCGGCWTGPSCGRPA